ncbi:MAG: SynChlorMet cassette radical SAM/SPASM protein ScmF [Dehalobacter sp.]|nr:SynChlorMet cassette radical SAM/SPASM protein ScmF [Dehalobacter sp.]
MHTKENIVNIVGDNYPLKTVYFYLTEGCNLRCCHCWIKPKYQTGSHIYPYLPLDLFHSIIKQAIPIGLVSVKLTGGEPLLHPNIDKILEFIRLKNVKLGVETNAVLCTPEIARLMASCRNPSVSVSLDGAIKETHEWVRGVEGCFNNAIQGIKNLTDAGIKPHITMSIMRHNKNEIEDVVRLAESLGASSVKFNIVQPLERGKVMHERNQALTIEEYINLGEWVELTLAKSTKIKLIYSHPVAFKPLGKMLCRNGDGCHVCGIKGTIGVLADGSYSLCGMGEKVPELVLGNAREGRLEDVWKHSQILGQVREGIPDSLEGICGECIVKRLCGGGCVAQNYYRNKNLWAPYWYCDEALKAGLFPKSRRFQ